MDGVESVRDDLMEWDILIDSPRPAAEHMRCDVQRATEGLTMLRVFTWDPPAISLGFKQALPEWLDQESWEAAGLELTERPTGGGIAFHGSDVSVSVIMPRTPRWNLQVLMGMICEHTVQLCHTYGVQANTLLEVEGSERIRYCLAEPSSYAILIEGKKVAGFAIRRFPEMWLIQGSLLVNQLPEPLRRRLPVQVRTQLALHAISLSEAAHHTLEPRDVAQRWGNWGQPPISFTPDHTWKSVAVPKCDSHAV